MKNIKSFIYGVAALALAGGAFASCQDNINAPGEALIAPEATWKANTTIMELKQEFWSKWKDDSQGRVGAMNEANNTYVVGTKENGEHYIIRGRVITSDEGGNMFRKIAIQDETAAIAISIYGYNLYLDYDYGQEILVDVTGLAVGTYGGMFQIGDPYWYESNEVWETSYTSPEKFAQHAQLNGRPDPAKVEIFTIESFNDMENYDEKPGLSDEDMMYWQGRMIRINNVNYLPQVYAGASGVVTTFGIYQVSNFYQQCVDSQNASVQIGVSGYSDFFWMEMPTVPSDLVTWLGYYSTSSGSWATTSWQLTPLNGDAFLNIGNPTHEAGTKENPYDVAAAVANIINDKASLCWVKGYIVGTVKAEVAEVTSANDIDFTAAPEMNNNVVIGLTAESRELNELIIVPLPLTDAGTPSDIRKYVALREHPENLGKSLAVSGIPTEYMSAYGIKDNYGTAAEFVLEGLELDDPSAMPDGQGTLESPYSAAQALQIIMDGKFTSDKVYVKGYVVGTPSIDTSYGNATYYISNDGTTANQLEVFRGYSLNGNKFKATDEIKTGDLLVVYGQLTMYGTTPEITQGSSIVSINDAGGSTGGGDTPEPPAIGGSGSGTESDPFNCASVIAMNPQSTTEAVKSGVWVEGYIVGYYQNYEAHFDASGTQAANILISDNASASSAAECVCIQLVASTDPRKALNLVDNPSMLGKKVQVKGDVMKYNTLPGIKNTSDYKLDGTSGGGSGTTDPEPPATGSEIYKGLVNGVDDWTITVDYGPDNVWAWKVYNNSGYLNGSAYVNGAAQEAEAYAFTTVDLSGYKSASVAFQHAAKFQTTLTTLCAMVVREAGASSWSKLSIPTWPAAGAWTFVDSGSISLNAYAGKKIEIGFLYGSDVTGADTWEIKNFVVTGSK